MGGSEYNGYMVNIEVGGNSVEEKKLEAVVKDHKAGQPRYELSSSSY